MRMKNSQEEEPDQHPGLTQVVLFCKFVPLKAMATEFTSISSGCVLINTIPQQGPEGYSTD